MASAEHEDGPTPPTRSGEAGATLTASADQQLSAVDASARVPLEFAAVPSSYYALEDEVGRGGVGVVVRAHDRRLGRRVALKQLQRIAPSSRLRFEREMRITAKLQHPGIVPIYEAGILESGSPFYSMKLIEGRSLKELIAAAATTEARLELLPTVLAVVETIAYAHSQGVVHRDIKPSNIIVGAFGETIVIDWGLAKYVKNEDPAVPDAGLYRGGLTPEMTEFGAVVGTPAYMPPEQARGDEVDESADVYSLGVVLRQLITGRIPYEAQSSQSLIEALLLGPPAPLQALAPEAPADLCAVIEKAMARDPKARYPNASELLVELKRFVTGRLVEAYSYRRVERLRKWVARRRSVVATSSIAAVILLAVSALSFQRIVRERDAALRSRFALSEKNDALILEQIGRDLDRKDPIGAFEAMKEYPKEADWTPVLPLVREMGLQGLPDAWSTDRIDSTALGGIDPSGRIYYWLQGNTLHLWDVKAVKPARSIELEGAKLEAALTMSTTYSGGTSIVIATRTGDVFIVDGDQAVAHGNDDQTGQRDVGLIAHVRPCAPRGVVDMAAHDGSRLIGYGCADGRAGLIDPGTATVRVLAQHQANASIFMTAPRLVASTGGDGRVSFWDPDGRRLGELPTPSRNGLLAGDEHCDELIVATPDGRVRLIRSPPSSSEESFDIDPGARIRHAGFGDSCRLIFGLSDAHRLVVVDVATRSVIATRTAKYARRAPNRPGFWLINEDSQLEYWEPRSGWSQSWPLGSLVTTLSVSEDGTAAALAGRIVIVKPERIPEVMSLRSPARTLAASDDEGVVGMGEVDGSVAIFSPRSNELTEHPSYHLGLALLRAGADEKLFSVGEHDGRVVEWDSQEVGSTVFTVGGDVDDIVVGRDDSVYIASSTGLLTRHLANGSVTDVDKGARRATRLSLNERVGNILAIGANGIVDQFELDLRFVSRRDVGLSLVGAAMVDPSTLLLLTTAGKLLKYPSLEVLDECGAAPTRWWKSSDSSRFLGACAGGAVIDWPVSDSSISKPLTGNIRDVDGVEGSQVFAAGSMDGLVGIVDPLHKSIRYMRSHSAVNNVELLWRSHLIVAASNDESLVVIWNIDSARSFPMDTSDLYNWVAKQGEW